MKTIVSRIKQQTLDDFTYEHNLTLRISERSLRDLGSLGNPAFRFYARFHGAEVRDGLILRSAHGNGETVADAIEDYMREISEQVLVFDAHKDSRKEIKVPFLTSVN